MQRANEILSDFKAHPEAWKSVHPVLQGSQNINTKFIALTILEETINVSTLPSMDHSHLFRSTQGSHAPKIFKISLKCVETVWAPRGDLAGVWE